MDQLAPPSLSRVLGGPACKDPAAAFEEGALLLWRDVPLPGLDRLRTLPLLPDPLLRKLKTKDIEGLKVKRLPWSLWASSPSKAQALWREVFRPAAIWINAFASEAFPSYRFASAMETWRFVETRDMAMHWDSYAVHVERIGLRVFVNVDSQPRLWALGPDLLDFAREHHERLDLGRCRTLSQVALACTKGLEPRDWPRIEIPPGGLLICQAQRVGHQVLYGRRMLGFAFQVETASLTRPENSPEGLVRRIHEDHRHA